MVDDDSRAVRPLTYRAECRCIAPEQHRVRSPLRHDHAVMPAGVRMPHAIDGEAGHAAADVARMLDDDVVMRCFMTQRCPASRPGSRYARLNGRHVAMPAQAGEAFDARAIRPARRAQGV